MRAANEPATSVDLAWAKEMPLRNAVVIYDTLYGKTRRVAQALARGLESQGVTAEVLSVHEASNRPIGTYDLIAMGAPAHHLAPPPAMRKFLHTMERMPNLREHYGYAFESRVRYHPGGAARWIEGELRRAGLRVPRTHDVAVIDGPEVPETDSGADPDRAHYRLHEGAEAYFESVGVYLAQRIRGELKADDY